MAEWSLWALVRMMMTEKVDAGHIQVFSLDVNLCISSLLHFQHRFLEPVIPHFTIYQNGQHFCNIL